MKCCTVHTVGLELVCGEFPVAVVVVAVKQSARDDGHCVVVAVGHEERGQLPLCEQLVAVAVGELEAELLARDVLCGNNAHSGVHVVRYAPRRRNVYTIYSTAE